jgi:hypothetical protein
MIEKQRKKFGKNYKPPDQRTSDSVVCPQAVKSSNAAFG